MRLHAKEILITFFGLVHLWIAFTFLVFSRAGSVNNRGVDDGALAQREAFFLQITIDDRQDCRRQFMLFQQVPEIHDRSVFRDRRAEGQTSELAHRRDFIQCFFHGWVAQREPVLQQLNTQHGLQRIRLTTTASFRVIMRIPRPSGHPFHQHPDTDSTLIRTLIPRVFGHRFHGHPDTFRQAATQDYSLPSTSFLEAKRSSWSVYPCVKSERYYA